MIKFKQKIISIKQYEKECDKIIAKKMDVAETLIELVEMASRYKIKNK